MLKTPSLVHLHGAAGVLEGEGAWPFLAMQAPHVNSLNKCSHFSQLIHPHVRMLKLCQPLNAASAPEGETVRHPDQRFPFPPQPALPKFLALLPPKGLLCTRQNATQAMS